MMSESYISPHDHERAARLDRLSLLSLQIAERAGECALGYGPAQTAIFRAASHELSQMIRTHGLIERLRLFPTKPLTPLQLNAIDQDRGDPKASACETPAPVTAPAQPLARMNSLSPLSPARPPHGILKRPPLRTPAQHPHGKSITPPDTDNQQTTDHVSSSFTETVPPAQLKREANELLKLIELCEALEESHETIPP